MGGSNSVALVGVVGLAAVMGMVAAAGIVATVASLSDTGRKQLNSPSSQLQLLSKAFPDTSGTATPMHDWMQLTNNVASLAQKTALPVSLLSTIRVSERIYYVR